MVLNEVKEYSILHADYDSTRRFELYSNMPLAVLYVEDASKTLLEVINQFEKMNIVNKDSTLTYDLLQLKDIVPYLKNNSFQEERELRLAFINWDGNLIRIKQRNFICMEQVQRYCYSKYWLRNVTVNCPNIPYISALK